MFKSSIVFKNTINRYTIYNNNNNNNIKRFITTINGNNTTNKTNSSDTTTTTNISTPESSLTKEQGAGEVKDDIFVKKNSVYKRFVEIPIEKQKELFDIALKRCGGIDVDDFHKIHYTEFLKSKEGTRLFGYHGGSMLNIAKTLYPNHKWKSWLFGRGTPIKDIDPNYDYKDEIYWYAQHQSIKDNDLDKWYDISFVDFYKKCRIRYVDSNRMMGHIIDAYPKHKFYLFKFSTYSSRAWDTPELIEEYRKFLFKETGFTTMEEFYFLPKRVLETKLYGRSLLYRLDDSTFKVYSFLFPDYEWIPEYCDSKYFRKLVNKERNQLKQQMIQTGTSIKTLKTTDPFPIKLKNRSLPPTGKKIKVQQIKDLISNKFKF